MITSKKTKTPRGGRNIVRRAMRSWDDTAARIDATWAFCDYLEGHPAKLAAIKKRSTTARRLMAEVGQFYLAEKMPRGVKGVVPIPRGTEFQVFEFDPREKRDKLVKIVLPPHGGVRGDATDVWRCTWPPWLQ